MSSGQSFQNKPSNQSYRNANTGLAFQPKAFPSKQGPPSVGGSNHQRPPNASATGGLNKIYVSKSQEGNALIKSLSINWEFVENKKIAYDYYIPPSAPRAWTYSRPTNSRLAQAALERSNRLTGQGLSLQGPDSSNQNLPEDQSLLTGAEFAATTATNVLFLSLKYYNLKPDYIGRRMAKFKREQPPGSLYDGCGPNRVNHLRIVLVLVDNDTPDTAIRALMKETFQYNFTMICAWTYQQCAYYIECLQRMQIYSLDPQAKRYDKREGIAEVGRDPGSKIAAKLKGAKDTQEPTWTGEDEREVKASSREVNTNSSGSDSTKGPEPSASEDTDLGVFAEWASYGESSKRKDPPSDTEPALAQDLVKKDTSPQQASKKDSDIQITATVTRKSVPEHYPQLIIDTITKIKRVNKTDAQSLLSRYGSIANAIKDQGRDLEDLPGWGSKKVDEFKKAMFMPFIDDELDPELDAGEIVDNQDAEADTSLADWD